MLDVRLGDLVTEGCDLALVLQVRRAPCAAPAAAGRGRQLMPMPACRPAPPHYCALSRGKQTQFVSSIRSMFRCCPVLRGVRQLIMCAEAVYK